MNKIIGSLLLIFLLLHSSISYAWGPALLRFLTSGTARAFNVSSKFITTQNALESLVERRMGNEYFRYDNGEIYDDPSPVSRNNIHAVTQGNKLRLDAWNYTDKARKTKNKNLNYKALAIYEDALSIDANNWQTWHGYGWSLAEVGQYQKASNAFTIAIYLGGSSESWRHLGWNYQRQGHLEEAKHFYIKALQINPTSTSAHAALDGLNRELQNNNNKTKTKIYTIQAGVFKNGRNALRTKEQLKTKHNIYISNKEDPNKYYVQVGQFTDKNIAVKEVSILKKNNPGFGFFVK